MPLTTKQRDLLEIVHRYGQDGTCEMMCQMGEYDYGNSEADQEKGRNVTYRVLCAQLAALCRKGLVADVDGFWELTGKGREVLGVTEDE